MIYYRHKETGFVVSHKDLKEIYNEAKEKGIYNYIVTFIAPYKLLPYEEEILKSENKMYEYNILEIPFSDDFEILEVDESLKSEDYIRLINILENSIITDKELIEKIRPIIHNKIRIELLLNNF